MQEHFGISPFSDSPRMEEVFNYIYSDAFSTSPPAGCLEAYWALIQLYTEAIGRTTNGLDGKSRNGVGALVRYLWRTDPECELTVVTFNQDLIVEKSIQAATETTKYAGIPWNIRHAYGIDFSRIAGVAAKKPFSDQATSSIQVLKLHGSLNWVYTVRSGADPKNSIRSPKASLLCINSQEVLSGLRYRPKKRWVDVIPLVVPPIYEKGSRYQDVVGPVWSAASIAITNCERLIVFGYSFPETDYAARSLFRRSFHENRALSSVAVVDVDPAVACKISTLLAPESCHHYRSVRALTEERGVRLISAAE